MESFLGILAEKLALHYDQTLHNICPNKLSPIFGDYMNSDQVYEDIQNMAALKKHMMEVLNEYNSSAGVIHMSLVLFRDAIEHSMSVYCFS